MKTLSSSPAPATESNELQDRADFLTSEVSRKGSFEVEPDQEAKCTTIYFLRECPFTDTNALGPCRLECESRWQTVLES